MLAAVELTAELAGGEFTDPVPYTGPWLLFALGAVCLVILYLGCVLFFTRARPLPTAAPADVRNLRAEHLAELDRIEEGVRAGALPLRAAYQQMSQVVRDYADQATPLPASAMSLTDLRDAGAGQLADAVAMMYPPEFEPGTPTPQREDERFRWALHAAREVVSTWS